MRPQKIYVDFYTTICLTFHLLFRLFLSCAATRSTFPIVIALAVGTQDGFGKVKRVVVISSAATSFASSQADTHSAHAATAGGTGRA